MTQATCSNCGELPRVRFYPKTGLCEACYTFQRKHGQSRRPENARTKGGATGLCSNCHQARAIALNLCAACYKHQRRHEKRRTRSLYNRRETCKNCGKPRTKKGFARGRCPACAVYWWRNRRERTNSIPPLGYCDCGQPATHGDVALNLATADGYMHTEIYSLCDDCYALEFEPIQTKGEAVWNR